MLFDDVASYSDGEAEFFIHLVPRFVAILFATLRESVTVFCFKRLFLFSHPSVSLWGLVQFVPSVPINSHLFADIYSIVLANHRETPTFPNEQRINR